MKRYLLPAFVVLAVEGSLLKGSTIDPARPYAWGANTGWITFVPSGEDGVAVGTAFLRGKAWAANFGWIGLGNGAPANGHSYSQTADDYGVNHDGTGDLAGWAWDANTGWINFGWGGANDPNRPRFSLENGGFSGFAWSPNVGWIRLGTLATSRIDCVDSDSDGMDDAWERRFFGNLTAAGIGSDTDLDGSSDAAEFAADTDPLDPTDLLSVTGSPDDPGRTTFTLHIASTRGSRFYKLQQSSTLVANTWSDVPGLEKFAADPGGVTIRSFSLPPGTARQFFRVVPVKPLQP